MMRWTRLRRAAGTALSAAALGSAALANRLPRGASLDQRLAAFPVRGLPLEGRVTVFWDEHQIPFIEAETDRDLAFTLGLVHAHLRLGQMETQRRVAQGRIAEMAGPLAVGIDHSLRLLGFGRAIPAVLAAMPEETGRWLEAFVQGINHYQATVRPLPHEYALLGLEREPWTAADVLSFGRLASLDVTWLVWFRLLDQRNRPDWPALWRRLVAEGEATIAAPLAADTDELQPLTDLLGGATRSGSNAVTVAAARSASGGALIACDPHLGLALPNAWLIAGYKSPSYHAVGLMVAGLPFVAVGRNPWIAWGGTNLRSANSDLFDVSALPPDGFTERPESIRVRWWLPRRVTLRDTALGPVISDAPLLHGRSREVLALRWIGHHPSDEMTAMLRVNRAQNWEQFRAALAGFAVSPQNMSYADCRGNIGMVMATHLPRRPPEPPADMVLPAAAAAAWEQILTSADLPATFNPPEGFVASANNRPAAATPVPIGWFFSPDDRIDRLTAVLAAAERVTVDDLKALQQDVYMASAVALRDTLVGRLKALPLDGRLTAAQRRVADLLAGWDGHYRAGSAGALAFELTACHLIRGFYPPQQFAAYSAFGRIFDLVRQDLAAAPAAQLEPAFDRALAAAAEPLDRYGVWGGMHRLQLAHMLGAVPVLGARYRFGDPPVGGSSSTLMKTAHPLTDRRHAAAFGANARHVSDLADPDRNWFVLLGGQDGWFNSSTFLDQAELWRRGAYVQVPLRPETVRARFPHRIALSR